MKPFTSETNFLRSISSLPPFPSVLFLWDHLPTDECILRASEVEPTGVRSKTALLITSSIMLVLLLGAAVIVWRKSRSRAKSTEKGGYAKKRASLITQLVKNQLAVQETLIRFLGREDPLEKG